MCNSYRQNVNFFNVVKYLVYGRERVDSLTTNIDSTGSNLLVRGANDPVPVFGARKKNRLRRLVPDEDHVNAFRNIQQKCLDNGIRLILVLPPLYYAPSEYFRQLVKKEILDDIILFDFTYTMQDASYFYNRDHLNSDGALVFSERVGEKFNKTVH